MKRLVCLPLALVMAISLCACGGNRSRSADAPTWQEQYGLGIRYLSEGNYEEAAIAFMAAIEIDPKQADAYLKAAEAYETMGDIEQAIAVLTDGAETTGDVGLSDYLMRLSGEENAEAESGQAPDAGAFPDPREFVLVGAIQSKRIGANDGYGIQEIDELGNMKRVWYFADGSMDYASLRFADSTVLYHFDSNWKPLRYSVSEVDEAGNQIKTYSYNADGSLNGWTDYVRNAEGEVVRIDEYSANGTLVNSQEQGGGPV